MEVSENYFWHLGHSKRPSKLCKACFRQYLCVFHPNCGFGVGVGLPVYWYTSCFSSFSCSNVPKISKILASITLTTSEPDSINSKRCPIQLGTQLRQSLKAIGLGGPSTKEGLNVDQIKGGTVFEPETSTGSFCMVRGGGGSGRRWAGRAVDNCACKNSPFEEGGSSHGGLRTR